MYGFLSDGAEYLAPSLQRMGSTTLDDVGKLMSGRNKQVQDIITRELYGGTKLIPGLGSKGAAKVARLAGRAVPLLSAGSVALDAADIVTNDTSLLNKGMDTAAMGIGGAIGGILGGPAAPIGAMVGASAGKSISDAVQYLFGDKKTPKQRELENALAALNAGRIG